MTLMYMLKSKSLTKLPHLLCMKVGNFFCTTHINSDFSVNPLLTSVFDQYKVLKTSRHVRWLCNCNGIFITVASSSSSSGVIMARFRDLCQTMA